MTHHGTSLKCNDHPNCRETLAGVNFDNVALQMRDSRHGTYHNLTLTLPEIVQILDPKGTTYRKTGQ